MTYGPWLSVITPKLAKKLDTWKKAGCSRNYDLYDSNFNSVIVWLYDGLLDAGIYVDSSNIDGNWDDLILKSKVGGCADADYSRRVS